MEAPSNKMKFVRLGGSGLKVSKVVLGCMSYGSPTWQPWVLGEEESMEHFKIAYDLGVNTWDTANVYSYGVSEELVGKAIKKYDLPRENLVIMTKCFFPCRTGNQTEFKILPVDQDEAAGLVNQQGLSRKNIFAAVNASLKRLQLDYIDVLQCHRFDKSTPIEETMRALHDVVQSGKVRYIGMSSCWAYQFHSMQAYAREHDLTQFISMQNYHNAVYREEEREMIPLCLQLGVGVIPYSPIAKGALARPVGAGSKRAEVDPIYKRRQAEQGESTVAIISAVEKIANARGVSMAQVATAWSLAQPGISAVLVGSTKPDHLTDVIGAVNLELSPEELKNISEHYSPRPIDGHA